MASPGDIRSGLTDPSINVTLQAMQETEADEVKELAAEQITAKESFQADLQESVNPFAKLKSTEKSIKPSKTRIQKMLKSGDKLDSEATQKQFKNSAEQFQRKNPELKSTVLLLLREQVKPGDSKEEILKKLQEFYPDVSLADEALEFLLETTDGELAKTVKEAKEEFGKLHGREIAAGRNIGAVAREAASQGLGTPTNMRDLYRNITGNPRDSTTLFNELSQKYAFKDLKKVVSFLLHSLGTDMKSKGPSIAHGQLHRLLTETRSLQAILGVYRFFNGRMPLVEKLFTKEGLQIPPQLNFETMAKQFMALTGERYPTGDKVLGTTVRLGVEKWLMAKIIVLSQLRDAIREVAVNQVYRSIQHRDELYMAILEALEDLEDELEELLDRERGDEDDEDDDDDNEDSNDPNKKKK